MTCSLLNLLFTPYERHPWDKSKSEWLWLVTTMWWVAGTVERQAAHFYRITVTESDLKSGLIITCKSTGKDKFKLVFFDQEVSSDSWRCHVLTRVCEQGHVTMVQESQQNKRCSAADLYVVPYGRYNLMESMPLSMMKHLEDDVPPVFMILDTFDKDIKVRNN